MTHDLSLLDLNTACPSGPALSLLPLSSLHLRTSPGLSLSLSLPRTFSPPSPPCLTRRAAVFFSLAPPLLLPAISSLSYPPHCRILLSHSPTPSPRLLLSVSPPRNRILLSPSPASSPRHLLLVSPPRCRILLSHSPSPFPPPGDLGREPAPSPLLSPSPVAARAYCTVQYALSRGPALSALPPEPFFFFKFPECVSALLLPVRLPPLATTAARGQGRLPPRGVGRKRRG